jgi:hypothetical protein
MIFVRISKGMMFCVMLLWTVLSTVSTAAAASCFFQRSRALSVWNRSRTLPVVKDTTDDHSEQALQLDPESIAGRIEQRLMERFAKAQSSTEHESGIARVLEYWRKRANEKYRNRAEIPLVFVGDPKLVDPDKSYCMQARNFHFAGLTCREFWDPADFAWYQELKSKYQAIRDEFFAVVAEGSDGFKSALKEYDQGVNGNLTKCEH